MNYAEIKNLDIANGLGLRVSLFVSGCTHHCKGCFNRSPGILITVSLLRSNARAFAGAVGERTYPRPVAFGR